MVDPKEDVNVKEIEDPSDDYSELKDQLDELDIDAEEDKGDFPFIDENSSEDEALKEDPAPEGDPDEKSGEGEPEKASKEDDATDDDDAGSKEGEEGESALDGKFSKELLAQARAVGFSDEDIGQVGSADGLQAIVGHMMTRIAEAGNAPVTDQDQEPKKSPLKEDPEGEVEKAGDPQFAIDLDGFEPEVADAVNASIQKVVDHFEGKFKAFEESNALRQEETQQREVAQFQADFDQFVEGLGEGFEDVLGKGPSADLGAPHQVARQKILEQALVLENGYRNMNIAMPDQATLLDQAARSVYGTKFETNAKKDVVRKAKKRSQQTINRAGGRAVEVEAPQDEDAEALEWGKGFLEKIGKPSTI